MKSNWPVVRKFDQEHLLKLALPLGGIGTGTISLGGRGNLRDFECMNQPIKNWSPSNCFFAIWIKDKKQTITRALEGNIDPSEYLGPHGCRVPNHGWPRFAKARFSAAYPLGQVELSDKSVPVDVRIEAFNPMIPGDADASGMPVAILRYVITNKTSRKLEIAVAGSFNNFIGSDGIDGKPKGNRNEWREGDGVQGIFMHSEGIERGDERFGTLALSTTATSGVSHRANWPKLTWGDALLSFWDDFSSDGVLEEVELATDPDSPTGSVAVKLPLPARKQVSVTFLVTWRFPNRMTWTPMKAETMVTLGVSKDPEKNPDCIGNYYATQFADAWDVAQKVAPRLDELEEKTVEFVQAFVDSDLPATIKDAALSNASTLRTHTCFRTRDGNFFGWEGCGWWDGQRDSRGCCHGSCTHVWNYEQATAFLYGEQSKCMREVEFFYSTHPEGRMAFRTNLPLDRAHDFQTAAADGQMGCLMKLYRDWQLSGDDEMLRKLWPNARKALEFCWIEGGWDADKDGVMEGCQHNTNDVEYYGPNPQMGAWYLGALRACEEMAKHLGEADFAQTCHDLYASGSKWMDEHLFNGEYYIHEIRPIPDATKIAKGLRHDHMGAQNLADPELQLGPGCLTDALVGQFMADICNLGNLLNPKNIRASLASLMRYNFKSDFSDHFNHLRSYALAGDGGMIIATWPHGGRPRRPFPYGLEVWTGLEYVAATQMIYADRPKDALKIIKAARDRHDGLKRSPFDEPECGHHYARAMSSWAAVLAWSGFHYSAVTGEFEIKATHKKSQCFWSNGYAWGIVRQKPKKKKTKVEIEVLHGLLKLNKITLAGFGSTELEETRAIDNKISITIKRRGK